MPAGPIWEKTGWPFGLYQLGAGAPPGFFSQKKVPIGNTFGLNRQPQLGGKDSYCLGAVLNPIAAFEPGRRIRPGPLSQEIFFHEGLPRLPIFFMGYLRRSGS